MPSASAVRARPLSAWFWADSRQQLSGLSLALMALLLALAVNVGVGTMVGSFSRTFLVWLDGRLAADVYIIASSDAQANEIKAWLRERPEVEAMLPGGRADTQLAARRSRCWACPITRPSRQLAAAGVDAGCLDPACVPAMPASSASNWRAV